MALWIVLTLLTSVAAVLMSAPFLRKLDERRGRLSDVAVYRDQLREVERDLSTGLIDPGQASSATHEIKRRMLAASRAAESVEPGRSVSPNFAIIAVAGFVVLGSVTLYAVKGRPDLPAAIPSARAFTQTVPPLTVTAASSEAPDSVAQNPAGANSGLATVDEMITRLVARLASKPDDPEGWRMLGWSYFHTDHYPEAVEAYAKAANLRPDIAAFQSSYGEALVRAQNETVSPEARALFEKALRLDPKDPRARFFIGLAEEQEGSKAAALETWVALMKDAGPNDEWAPDLKVRIAALGKEIGPIPDLNVQAGSTVATPVPATPSVKRGPSAGDILAAQSMSEEDRSAMIRRMVDGLANRLAQSPQDSDGWVRLIRARKVLGETSAAKDSLRQALLAFPEGGQDRDGILAAARELGLIE